MLSSLSLLSPLLPLILFLLFCLRKGEKELWVIFIYILLSFSVDIFQRSPSGKNHSLTILAFFTIAEYAIFSYFFYLVIGSRLMKKIILILTVCVVIVLLIVLLNSSKKNFDSFSASLESIIVIILSIIFFFEKVNKSSAEVFIYSLPSFWIVFAFMIYMSGTLFLFILANGSAGKYWFINNIFNIITNVLFSAAFLVSRFAAPDPSLENPYVDFTRFPEER